ncbi:MAG TPA: DUF5361 domain-containing protein [Acidothermaceae bacterium]
MAETAHEVIGVDGVYAGRHGGGRRGEIVDLVRILDEYGDAVEADFCHTYPQYDLLDLYRGKLSVRRCWLLITQLPGDSALARAAHPDAADWSLTNHLLAATVDVLQLANWQRSSDAKIPRPARIPRPGVPDGAKDKASDTERKARAFLERQKQREAG